MDELMTVEELAAYLKKPVPTIYQWNSRGDGPPYIRVGRTVVYRRAGVERWLTDRYARSARA